MNSKKQQVLCFSKVTTLMSPFRYQLAMENLYFIKQRQ